MPELNRFAALESRLNGAVEVHLSNAIAEFGGGVPFGVDFGRAQAADPFGGVAVDAADFRAAFDAARAPGLIEGSVLTVDGEDYRVVGGVQPDQSGWLSVSLYLIN